LRRAHFARPAPAVPAAPAIRLAARIRSAALALALVVVSAGGAAATRPDASESPDASAIPAASAIRGASATPAASAIQAVLEAASAIPDPTPSARRAQAFAAAYYRRNAFRPVWSVADPSPASAVPGGGAGARGERVDRVVALLAHAQEQGLRARDYDADALRAQRARPLDTDAAARFDVHLTQALVRYLFDVNLGRIDPATLGLHMPARRDRATLEAGIDAVLASASPADAAAALTPELRLYRDLLASLAQMRALAAGTPPPPLPVIGRSLRPGDAHEDLAPLAIRLRWLGDLVDDAAGLGSAPLTRYEGALVAAVERLQARHGLEADGVLGPQTLAALAVPPAVRVQQIEWSLERLRWLGRLPAGRFVAINIPEFRLWAVPAAQPGGQGVLQMRVIVGATVTATPVFADAIDAVEFNPYWNVPPSIASKELYPKLARDPGYLARQQMERLGDAGGDLRAALASGRARIRQLPGTLNALGAIKFVMPNTFNVYLHDTPSRTLFARSRRDFSHGCIRLERPRELAAWILADQPQWDAAAIDQAVAEGRNRTVRVTAPVPVLILYSTVNVDADGRPRFLPDVYGLDAKLARALGD